VTHPDSRTAAFRVVEAGADHREALVALLVAIEREAGRDAHSLARLEDHLHEALAARSWAPWDRSLLIVAGADRADDPDGGEGTDATPAPLVGWASCIELPKLDERRGFLFVDELGVLEAWRRRGVGRAILAETLACARRRGLCGVRLLVRPENEAARRLYVSAGFVEGPALFCERLL